METIQRTSEGLLAKARSAILEGGHDDLASVAQRLAGLIGEQQPLLKDNDVSSLAKPLLAIANILAADDDFLSEAITTFGEAAQSTVGRDDELNIQSVVSILEKAESLPTSADRIGAYQLALQGAPASSAIAALARHKSLEQEDPAYFRMRTPLERPRLEEAIIEGDLKAILGDIDCRVIRHQAPTGVIYYSIVVPRGFSRNKLIHAGIQGTQELVRTKGDEDSDRIIIPETRLSAQTQRDIDFMSRLRKSGIYIEANHGRTRDAKGRVTGYKLAEGANPDRMRYMGIDAHSIFPHDGKITVPIERIRFFADPAIIGKWRWIFAGGGKMKSCIPLNERPMLIRSLETHGISPYEDITSTGNIGYIIVGEEARGRLKNIIHQHTLQERSKNLLDFAEALPGFANNIAVAAYKDACSFVFGLRNSR